jgi:hypothetical protein
MPSLIGVIAKLKELSIDLNILMLAEHTDNLHRQLV